MNIGMLWFDDDKQRQLDEKVARAAEYYRAKYGVQPTECYVHPLTLGDSGAVTAGEKAATAAGVRLRPSRTIIKNHFWLGVGDSAAQPAESGAGRKGRK
jgi:hypothetical protein